MDVKIDLKVAELLSSRLCHDLISPIGAVNNGLELLEDEESGMSDDALELSIKSARRASNILQAVRVAVGAAGSQSSVRLADARNLASGLLEGGKIRLDWPTDSDQMAVPTGTPKLILNLVMLASECLPRGGVVSVTLDRAADRIGMRVTAAGQGGRLPPEFLTALSPDAAVADLTAKTVQGYFAAKLAEGFGGRLELPAAAPDTVVFAVSLPSA